MNPEPVFSVAWHTSPSVAVFGLGAPGVTNNVGYTLLFERLQIHKLRAPEVKRLEAIRKQQKRGIWKCQVHFVTDRVCALVRRVGQLSLKLMGRGRRWAGGMAGSCW